MNEETGKAEEVTTDVPETGTDEDKVDSTSIINENIDESKIDNASISDADTEENKIDSLSTPAANTDKDKVDAESTVPIDLSKVKIRNVLRERIKKCKLNLKKIIACILVGAVCFGAGFFTGRVSIRHNLGRNVYGKPGIRRNMHGNFKGNKKFKSYQNGGAQSPQQGESQTQVQPQ